LMQVRIVKAAEADAEAKYLAGQGIARQRQVGWLTVACSRLQAMPLRLSTCRVAATGARRALCLVRCEMLSALAALCAHLRLQLDQGVCSLGPFLCCGQPPFAHPPRFCNLSFFLCRRPSSRG
jgi:hypothetical protein